MAHQRHLGVIGFFLTSLFLAVPQAGTAVDDAEQPDTWQIHGRVVDAAGKPVDDFVAATFWSSNGKQWNEKGEFIHLQGSKHLDQFWKEEGVLEPFPNELAKRLTDGEFVATVNDRPRVSVFVTDRQQQRGGFVSVEKTAADKPVTVTLLPLVRVTGKLYCPQAGARPTGRWPSSIPSEIKRITCTLPIADH